MPDRRVDVSVRVRYAETDALGIAYHSNFFVWFEVGRSEYFRAAVGESPAEFFRHYGMPLVEAAARYHNSCRYDDVLIVSTRIGEMRSRSLRFEYEVRRQHDGALLAQGHTTHICTDGDGRPCRMPDWLQTRLQG